MVGKISSALLRREADTYRAQGLHEEALKLFKRVLVSQTDIAPEIKAAIETQIRQIEAELARVDSDERLQISDEQIAVIREGWCAAATPDDLAVCASSFHAMGFYEDALIEFKKLALHGHPIGEITGLIADCVVRLHTPERVCDEAERLAQELLPDPEKAFGFMLSLAEHIAKGGHADHAIAIAKHLQQFAGAPKACQSRVVALVNGLSLPDRRAEPQGAPPAPSAAAGIPVRAGLAKILSILKRLFNRP